jgi:hypothetical protein
MRRVLMIACAFVASTLFAFSVTAEPKPLQKADPKDTFELGQKAFEVAGVKILKQSAAKAIEGKLVKEYESSWKIDKVRDKFLDMLKKGTDVDGGRVVGMAYQDLSKTWNVTVRKGDTIQVINVRSVPTGTVLGVRKALNAPIKTEELTPEGEPVVE